MKLQRLITETHAPAARKVVFVETDGRQPFPAGTIKALQKQITMSAGDLSLNWKTAVELVDHVFAKLDVPKPQTYSAARWAQYTELLKHAVNKLFAARGNTGTASQI